MAKLNKNGIIRFFIDTPKKQFKKKQLISKIIITLAVFCIVFIPSFIVYSEIFNLTQSVTKATYYQNNFFSISPGWNDIKQNYTIWANLAKRSKNWLLAVQILTGLGGVLLLSLCWCYINNRIVFTFSMFAYMGIMFNWIDASIGGYAFDYITLTSKYEWIHKTFLWPSYLPLILGPNSQATGGHFNLPDVFLSFGVINMLAGFIVLAIFKIEEQIKKIDEKTVLYHLKK